ncbi:hypothetical protein IGI04_034297 [Brassica rapa subsp. trilocularis]|uniref:Uncharacterized protein n=1 Tax=Brassica rapa subsp. trilocularis TaxID=1813537 RepID=A0ABQ7L9A4_BRACM|nr:hypothetical protein IGI04_034297 [Brassica rapa subsp. trilocularis]
MSLFIYGTEVPKRPTKPRKRKNPTTVSSLQPVSCAESTSTYPTTSSALEQISLPVQHVKKVKHRLPLKINKVDQFQKVLAYYIVYIHGSRF